MFSVTVAELRGHALAGSRARRAEAGAAWRHGLSPDKPIAGASVSADPSAPGMIDPHAARSAGAEFAESIGEVVG
jgi:hypothetical protein